MTDEELPQLPKMKEDNQITPDKQETIDLLISNSQRQTELLIYFLRNFKK